MSFETEIDECASNPCAHGGSCEDFLTWYTCTCATGFIGSDCETSKFNVKQKKINF